MFGAPESEEDTDRRWPLAVMLKGRSCRNVDGSCLRAWQDSRTDGASLYRLLGLLRGRQQFAVSRRRVTIFYNLEAVTAPTGRFVLSTDGTTECLWSPGSCLLRSGPALLTAVTGSLSSLLSHASFGWMSHLTSASGPICAARTYNSNYAIILFSCIDLMSTKKKRFLLHRSETNVPLKHS